MTIHYYENKHSNLLLASNPSGINKYIQLHKPLYYQELLARARE